MGKNPSRPDQHQHSLSVCVCHSAPVDLQIFPEDGQQRVSELRQLAVVFLDSPQVLEKSLGGVLHLAGEAESSMGTEHMVLEIDDKSIFFKKK